MILMHILALTSSILMGPVAYLSNYYEAIIFGRLINGIARGTGFSLGPLYVAEVVSRKTLAFYQTPLGWMLQMSAALGNVLAHPHVLGGVDTWPYVLALPGIFSLVYLLCVPWIPHTLTATIQNERKQSNQGIKTHCAERAFNLLRRLRYEKTDFLRKEYESIVAEIDADAQVERASIKELLSIGKYRHQLFVVIIIQLSIQLTGIQAVFQYTNQIFETAGIPQEHSTYYSISK